MKILHKEFKEQQQKRNGYFNFQAVNYEKHFPKRHEKKDNIIMALAHMLLPLLSDIPLLSDMFQGINTIRTNA